MLAEDSIVAITMFARSLVLNTGVSISGVSKVPWLLWIVVGLEIVTLWTIGWRTPPGYYWLRGLTWLQPPTDCQRWYRRDICSGDIVVGSHHCHLQLAFYSPLSCWCKLQLTQAIFINESRVNKSLMCEMRGTHGTVQRETLSTAASVTDGFLNEDHTTGSSSHVHNFVKVHSMTFHWLGHHLPQNIAAHPPGGITFRSHAPVKLLVYNLLHPLVYHIYKWFFLLCSLTGFSVKVKIQSKF